MSIDRYTKIVLTVLAVALGVLALNPWLVPQRGSLPLGSQPAEAQTGPQFELEIPRAWGKLVGYSPGNVLLEAPDGSLREVNLRGSGPEFPQVKFHARWK